VAFAKNRRSQEFWRMALSLFLTSHAQAHSWLEWVAGALTAVSWYPLAVPQKLRGAVTYGPSA
jgi:hypothetical protein